MHELGVYFHRCAGNTWELSGEVAEHLEGGTGAEVGVSRCVLGVPHQVYIIIYTVRSPCIIYGTIIIGSGAVILSHLDFAPVAAHFHYLLGGQLKVLEPCLNKRLSSPHVIDSVTLNAYKFAKVRQASLCYSFPYIRFPIFLLSIYIILKQLFIGVLQVLDNVLEVAEPT